ncbi:hypothetical protein H4R18_000644 [Coemansia javaensis]|uniref:2'-5' RNA ligase family protein n=1 Tax=Coemansia javaensis TaxID=2761396 RepID=A0A9W8LK99_9FUNG|nr:hypothetical protein H4R18_000644 [Coemansia javaensis]
MIVSTALAHAPGALIQDAAGGEQQPLALVQAAPKRARVPRPLRAAAYWSGARGRCRCIIYLEPRRGTALRTALDGFLRASAEQLGPTEAHQYHPHSSMTGFIDLTACEIDGMAARIAVHLHEAVAGRRGGLAAPRVKGVAAVDGYPHAGTHKVELQLDTPPAFRAIVDEVARAAPEAAIRPKRMGHISLAYRNKHVDSGTVVSADHAQALAALARAFLADPAIADPAQNLWDIAFYELSFKSASLATPHRFTQIARWRL